MQEALVARWLDNVSAWKQREVMRHSEEAEAEDAVKKEVKAKSLKALEKLGHHGLVMDEYESEHPSYARCRPTECPGLSQAKLPQR